MKTSKPISVFLSAIILFSASAYASPAHERGYERKGHYEPVQHVRMNNYYRSNDHARGSWVVPLVIGGVLGYVLSEPRRETVSYVSTVQTPTVYAPQSVYQEQWVYFSDCDCQRKVLVPVR